MRIFLYCLFIIPCIAISGETPQAGLFQLAQQVPQSVTSWLTAFKRTDPHAHIDSTTELIHQNYQRGYRVEMVSPEAEVLIWVGFGEDYKKELPLKIKIKDLNLISDLGLQTASIEAAVTSNALRCGSATCAHTFTGPCAEFGMCYQATLTTANGEFSSIEWTYPID